MPGVEVFGDVATRTDGTTVVVGGRRSRRGEKATVAAIEPDGRRAWATRLGCADDEDSMAMAMRRDGSVVVVGRCFGHEDRSRQAYAVTAIDIAGTVLWTRQLPYTRTAFFPAIAVNANGAIVLAGALEGRLDLAGARVEAERGIAVVKLSPDGAYVWARTFEAKVANTRAVAVDAGGDVWVAGDFLFELVFDNFQLGDRGSDAFVVKLAGRDGAVVRAERFGLSESAITTIAAGADGAVFVAGRAPFPIDDSARRKDPYADQVAIEYGTASRPFVAKLATTGGREWLSRAGYARPGLDEATHLVVAPDGDLVVGGDYYDGFAWGGDRVDVNRSPDVFVTRIAPDGAPRWMRRLSTDLSDELQGLSVDAVGRVAAAWTSTFVPPTTGAEVVVRAAKLSRFAP